MSPSVVPIVELVGPDVVTGAAVDSALVELVVTGAAPGGVVAPSEPQAAAKRPTALSAITQVRIVHTSGFSLALGCPVIQGPLTRHPRSPDIRRTRSGHDVVHPAHNACRWMRLSVAESAEESDIRACCLGSVFWLRGAQAYGGAVGSGRHGSYR